MKLTLTMSFAGRSVSVDAPITKGRVSMAIQTLKVGLHPDFHADIDAHFGALIQ